MPALVKVEKLAAAMDIDPRRVQQLAKLEGMPKAGRGFYDLGKCMAWYIRYLHGKMKQKAAMAPDGEFATLQGARSALLQLERDLKELELGRQRRELVSIADVEKEFTDLVITTKARILTVPARVAPELLGEQSRVMVQAKIEKGLKEALSHLSELRK